MVATKDAKGKPPAKPAGKGGKDEKAADESVSRLCFALKSLGIPWYSEYISILFLFSLSPSK